MEKNYSSKCFVLRFCFDTSTGVVDYTTYRCLINRIVYRLKLNQNEDNSSNNKQLEPSHILDVSPPQRKDRTRTLFYFLVPRPFTL